MLCINENRFANKCNHRDYSIQLKIPARLYQGGFIMKHMMLPRGPLRILNYNQLFTGSCQENKCLTTSLTPHLHLYPILSLMTKHVLTWLSWSLLLFGKTDNTVFVGSGFSSLSFLCKWVSCKIEKLVCQS